MKTINRENYEEFCLDYFEENLTEDLKSEFEDFMKENPDLDNDLKDVELFYLPEPENVVYSDKESLMKKTTPVVRRMRPVYWRWAVAAACFLGIIGGVLFVQSNQDGPSFADVNTQKEVPNEPLADNEEETNQNSKYQIANVEPEIVNTPEERITNNRTTIEQASQPINESFSNRYINQTIVSNNTSKAKGVETTPEIENDPLIDVSIEDVNKNRIAYNEVLSLETPQNSIAFEGTSTSFDSKDIPLISVSEQSRRGFFRDRFNLEDRGLISDAYSVSKDELKETLTPDTYPIAVSNEDLKESFVPDTYSLEINKEELKEAFIPETFAAVFK